MKEELGNCNSRIASRSYTSWAVYMLMFVLGIFITPKLWYLYLLVGGFLTYIFFHMKNERLLDVYTNGIVIYPDSEKERILTEDQFVSFRYANEQAQNIIIEYLDGEEKLHQITIECANAAKIHSELNKYYTDKNKVRNDYKERVEKTKLANRLIWQDFKDKITHLFRK